jgi:hypothetical protein
MTMNEKKAMQSFPHKASGRMNITGSADSTTENRDPMSSLLSTQGATSPEAGRQGANRCLQRPKEIGGPKGPEPTRYGDWERNGRCTDF